MEKNKIVIDVPQNKECYRNASELEEVLPEIKKVVCGKPLLKILNKTVWDADFIGDTECFADYNVDNVFFEDFEFIIDNEILSVSIDGPTYSIKLNNDEIETINPTKDVPINSLIGKGYGTKGIYNDISHIYASLIGKLITDITLGLEIDEEEGKEIHDLEAFVIHLSNGQKIEVTNQQDNPCIHILWEKTGKETQKEVVNENSKKNSWNII